jgi:hypothetical protein
MSLLVVARACPALEELDVSGAKPSSFPAASCITDHGVAALGALRRLRALAIDGARHVTAAGLGALVAPAPAAPPSPVSLLVPRPRVRPRSPLPLGVGGSAAAAAPPPSPPATPPQEPQQQPQQQRLPPPPLEELSCADCPALSDAALAPMAAALAPTLRALRLDGCPQITNRGLRRLVDLTELRELSLRGTLVEPRGAAWGALAARVHRVVCDPRAGLHLVGLMD